MPLTTGQVGQVEAVAGTSATAYLHTPATAYLHSPVIAWRPQEGLAEVWLRKGDGQEDAARPQHPVDVVQSGTHAGPDLRFRVPGAFVMQGSSGSSTCQMLQP